VPVGFGYFLAPGGQVIVIDEHLAAVEKNPRQFGLCREDVEPRDAAERHDREARRRRVLTLVLKNGFTRARFSNRRRVCEYWATTPAEDARRLEVIKAFLSKQGILNCVILNVGRRG
jgi:hypothetical protein